MLDDCQCIVSVNCGQRHQGSVAGRADEVIREAEVEHLLHAQLRQAGYGVQERVPLSSGIIDAG